MKLARWKRNISGNLIAGFNAMGKFHLLLKIACCSAGKHNLVDAWAVTSATS